MSAIELPVAGAGVTFTLVREDDGPWVAVGELNGVGIELEGHEIEPEGLRLIVLDPADVHDDEGARA